MFSKMETGDDSSIPMSKIAAAMALCSSSSVIDELIFAVPILNLLGSFRDIGSCLLFLLVALVAVEEVAGIAILLTTGPRPAGRICRLFVEDGCGLDGDVEIPPSGVAEDEAGPAHARPAAADTSTTSSSC